MQIQWHIFLIYPKVKEKKKKEKNQDEGKDNLENSVHLICSQFSVVC